MRVEVYYNLHSGRWSVRALDGEHRGRVVAHAAQVTISDAEFAVSEAGRQRVIREQRKNVHAFVRGELLQIGGASWRYVIPEAELEGVPFIPVAEMDVDTSERDRVSYNPYKAPAFYRKDTGEFLTGARVVYLNDDRSVRAFSAYGSHPPHYEHDSTVRSDYGITI